MPKPIKGSPSVPKDSPLHGPRTGRETRTLTNNTRERALTSPSKMGCYNTKFKTRYEDPLEIPKDLVHPSRAVQDNRHWLDVAVPGRGEHELPED